MNDYQWADKFQAVYDKALAAYQGGNHKPGAGLAKADREFLAAMGHTVQELFDFIEDVGNGGEPSFATALLVASVRRDFFLVIQKGQPSKRQVSMTDLPPKDAAVDGLAWLPRLIAKARAKLRGEMPPDLMYCCGGDRAFLNKVGIHPADFLRTVWSARDDDRKVIDWVKAKARSAK